MPADPKPVTIRLKGKDYTEFRKQVYAHFTGICQGCGGYYPLTIEGYDGKMYFDEFRCGHISHKKSHGAGGGDTLDNTLWHCFSCHRDYEDHTGIYKNRGKKH